MAPPRKPHKAKNGAFPPGGGTKQAWILSERRNDALKRPESMKLSLNIWVVGRGGEGQHGLGGEVRLGLRGTVPGIE